MQKLIVILSLIMAVLFSSHNSQAQTTIQKHSIDDYYRYQGPDIDLQGGAGYQWNTSNLLHTPNTALGMGRLRVGYMYVPGYPWGYSIGATVELNTATSMVWGVQAEVINVGAGLWFRAGGGADYQGHFHYNAALGWSLVGVEVNGFSNSPLDERQGVELLGVVRIPIGYFLYVSHILNNH